MVTINAIRLSGNGYSHEHIIHVWWQDAGSVDPSKRAGDMDIGTTINWLNHGNHAFVTVGGATAEVKVVSPSSGRPYIRTTPDHTKKDNLLNLPRR